MKVGDLVYVFRPPICGCQGCVGKIFLISRIYHGSPDSLCLTCGGARSSELLRATCPKFGVGGYELSILKRIPPIEELDKLIEEKELENQL